MDDYIVHVRKFNLLDKPMYQGVTFNRDEFNTLAKTLIVKLETSPPFPAIVLEPAAAAAADDIATQRPSFMEPVPQLSIVVRIISSLSLLIVVFCFSQGGC